MRYDKMAGEIPRVLLLRSQYWLDGACENAGRSLGWEITPVPVVMEGALSQQQVANFIDAIVSIRPDFILSINLAAMDQDGLFARFFDDLEVPHVTWFVDDPRTIIMGNTSYASAHTIALTWDRAYLDYLKRAGFSHAHWMPLAADTSVFNGEPSPTPSFPPTFVGNSMEWFAARAWESVTADPKLLAAAQAAFEGERVTRERFGSGLDAIVGADFYGELDEEQRRSLEMLFFLEGTRRYRRRYLERLHDEGVRVRGDADWRRWMSDAGPPVHYFNELPAFYRECEVNLNFTSIQMPGAVNQRVFDCPAAGGFLLTDAQADLSNLFDTEVEVASFGSVEECVEKLRWFRDRPNARREILERARSRILREHTYVHRMKAIARLVLEHFGK